MKKWWPIFCTQFCQMCLIFQVFSWSYLCQLKVFQSFSLPYCVYYLRALVNLLGPESERSMGQLILLKLFSTSCGNDSHISTCCPGTIWLTVTLPLWYVCCLCNVMSQILKWSSFILMQWQTGHSHEQLSCSNTSTPHKLITQSWSYFLILCNYHWSSHIRCYNVNFKFPCPNSESPWKMDLDTN